MYEKMLSVCQCSLIFATCNMVFNRKNRELSIAVNRILFPPDIWSFVS